jgi:hypothetical protein
MVLLEMLGHLASLERREHQACLVQMVLQAKQDHLVRME